jgi:excisionase family DNA binding protein
MSLALIDEGRLQKLEMGLERILAKLSEPVSRVKGDDKDTYTIAELADKLCWSRSKVSAELQSGRIRSHRVGGRVTILRNELLEDLAKL